MSAEEPGHTPNGPEETYAVSDHERQRFFGETEPMSSSAARFSPGDLLASRFEIIRFLARGGMGEVYEARDGLLHGSRVALKAILPKNALETEARTRLKQEVMLARQVTHPNVCPIYDLFECDRPQDTCFLTMKLLQGETLARRLRRQKPLDLEEGLTIMRQLCGALRAAHRAGVVHRDLKPGNVMLQGEGSSTNAIVTDFGIARDYQADLTISTGGHILGTPGYIAPELYRGSPATPASDLFALGVVLHEIFTGKKPVRVSKDPNEVTPVELQKKNIPTLCSRLIAACLDPVPEVRDREFERAIQRLGIEAQVTEMRLGGGPVSRRTLLSLGGAAAFTIAAAVLWEEDLFDNILHPLPRRRFVALLDFPPSSDPRIRPLVSGAIAAIETELSRAEAFDQNLYIVAAHNNPNTSEASQLKIVQDSLGANLALAAHGMLVGGSFHLLLKVLDASTGSLLRFRRVVSKTSEIASSAQEAVRAAATLLNVNFRGSNTELPTIATHSEEAYKAFQTAEDLIVQPNDAGLDKALENYRAAVDADPKYAIAYSKIAVAYCRLYSLHGDPAALDLARRNAETGLKLDKNLIHGHLALSSVYDLTGKKQQALNEIGKALALDPANAKTLLWQGQIYRRMNRWAEAEQIYRRILDERPNYWPAYNDIGYVLNAQGRYREALRAFQSATVAAPRSALAFTNVGAMYLKLGEFQEAKQNFQKSLQLDPKDLAYSNLATALRLEGNYMEALPMYLKATTIGPSDDQNWLDLGDCYEAMPQKEREAHEAYARAEEEVKRALQLDPSDGGAWIRLALYRVKSKQAGDAMRLLEKGLSLGSPDLDSELTEARIFEQLGNRQEALTILSKCFGQGLTSFEVAAIPDLQTLRRDPAFSRIASANTVGGKTQQQSH